MHIIKKINARGINLIFFLLQLGMVYSQTENLVSSGDMENGGWTAVPGNTDLVLSFEENGGVNSSTSLKAVTTEMGGDNYYILRCEDIFHLDKYSRVWINFHARASQPGIRLQAWIQEGDEFEWMNLGDAYLSTEWEAYIFTSVVSTRTSENYKIKFRVYDTGTVYVDELKLGPGIFKDIPQSDIYGVTALINDSDSVLNVFRHACPVYSPGYQGMGSKDQKPLNLFAGRTINWTKIIVDEPVTVRVKVTNTGKVPVSGQEVRILPSRYGIEAKTNGNIISFIIEKPAQYYVEIGENGYKNGLIIFADPPETDIPGKDNSDFLILNTASEEDMSLIPDTVSGLYFEKGIHDIGVFNIPHHVKDVYFEDGSWVYGTMIMDGNPDVRIFGRGVLSSARLNYRQSHCVEAINGSNNIIVEGLVVADPKYFAVRLVGRNNNVNYTKVIGGWVYNCDGISAFKGSSVSKCFIWANDDAIKVYRDSITWSDIVVWVLENGGVIQTSWGGAVGGSTSKGVKLSRIDILNAEWDKPGFNCALLSCVGNHYHIPGKSDELVNWLIEDVVTENTIPVIFNITPDSYSHTHIHGMKLKNWNVMMPMNTSFVNEIKGEDPGDFLSGFIFDSVVFNQKLLTNINYITRGDMESGGWVGEPGTTNQVVSLDPGIGIDESTGLKSVVTDLGQDVYYAIKCNQYFKLSQPEDIKISFMARSNLKETFLGPGIVEKDEKNWEYFESVSIDQEWHRYSTESVYSLDTSDLYQLKFRAYGINTVIYLDDVKIGPPDWLEIAGLETRYFVTPGFIPEYINPITYISERSFVNHRLNVYPNPVDDVLIVSADSQDFSYSIYSMTGKKVMAGKETRINTSGLTPGLYILIGQKGEMVKFLKE